MHFTAERKKTFMLPKARFKHPSTKYFIYFLQIYPTVQQNCVLKINVIISYRMKQSK